MSLTQEKTRPKLRKLIERLQSDGLLNTLPLLTRRLLRFQRHCVYMACYGDAKEPDWLPGEEVCFLASSNDSRNEAVWNQLVAISRDNAEYREAVSRGQAEGLVVLHDGQVVHHAFLLYGNKTARLVGFARRYGLSGNAYTVRSYRGRACHARSVAARIKMAQRSGLDGVVSITSYDNIPSQRGMLKGGMRYIGTIEMLVLLNTLVVRYKRPDASFKRIEFCW